MTPVLGGRRELRASLLLGLCCLLVYNANGRAISAGDAFPARYLPFVIWRYHSLLLDPIAPLAAQGRGHTAFWMMHTPGGHAISLYPVVLPVLLAPLYFPAAGYLHFKGWTDGRLDHIARVMEKLSASLVAALSASLLYLLLRRRAAAPIALLLTLAYAFGTTTWVIGSQALWQHGMAELLVIGLLLLLTAPCTAPRALAAGLLCGLIAGNRPPDVVLAAALGAYGLFWAGRRAALLAAAAALPAGLVLLYNLGVADNLAGGYGRVGKASFLQHGLLSGLGGLLFSPTRGLFVFSPFLLFLVLAWRHLPRGDSGRGERGLTLAISAGQEVVATGWALAGHATPWQVAVAIDGRQPVASHTCLDRTDIRGTLHEASPAGWRIPLGTAGLAPGEHHLAALAWASENGEAYYLAERKLTVRAAGEAKPAADEDLNAGFRTAAARLRAHQQGPGYWL